MLGGKWFAEGKGKGCRLLRYHVAVDSRVSGP